MCVHVYVYVCVGASYSNMKYSLVRGEEEPDSVHILRNGILLRKTPTATIQQ